MALWVVARINVKPMSDIEQIIRFILERVDLYTKGHGDTETQFGYYQLTMPLSHPDGMLDNSKAHREKRIKAIKHLLLKHIVSDA